MPNAPINPELSNANTSQPVCSCSRQVAPALSVVSEGTVHLKSIRHKAAWHLKLCIPLLPRNFSLDSFFTFEFPQFDQLDSFYSFGVISPCNFEMTADTPQCRSPQGAAILHAGG